MTLRGYSNLKRAITKFENKYNVSLLNVEFCDLFYCDTLNNWLEYIKEQDNPKFNRGWRIIVSEKEVIITLEEEGILFADNSVLLDR